MSVRVTIEPPTPATAAPPGPELTRGDKLQHSVSDPTPDLERGRSFSLPALHPGRRQSSLANWLLFLPTKKTSKRNSNPHPLSQSFSLSRPGSGSWSEGHTVIDKDHLSPTSNSTTLATKQDVGNLSENHPGKDISGEAVTPSWLKHFWPWLQPRSKPKPIPPVVIMPKEIVIPPTPMEPPPSPPLQSPAPPSAHDVVVNKLLDRRPFMPHRAASLPSRNVAPAPERRASDTEDLEEKSVAALLDGPLEPNGVRVTKALATQMEAVLHAQEEIGRAHLALEGICQPGKDRKKSTLAELEARAASVDEIMNRLSELSTSLKSYHAIGTPMVSFPRQQTPLSPREPHIVIANPRVAMPRSQTNDSFTSGTTVQSPQPMSPTNPRAWTGPGPFPFPTSNWGTPNMGRRLNAWTQRPEDSPVVASPTELTPASKRPF